MSKVKTKEYEVVRGGIKLNMKADELEVGSIVKLTEKQAKAFVGKVVLCRPKSESNQNSDEEVAQANAELAKAKGEVEAVKADLEKANAELAKAKEEIELLKKANAEAAKAQDSKPQGADKQPPKTK